MARVQVLSVSCATQTQCFTTHYIGNLRFNFTFRSNDARNKRLGFVHLRVETKAFRSVRKLASSGNNLATFFVLFFQ